MPLRKGEYLLLNDETAGMDISLVDNIDLEEGPSTSSCVGPSSQTDAQNAIMMYSNETEEPGFRGNFDRQVSWGVQQVHAERDENIKCIVTSILIVAIIAALLTIIFIRNPEM